MLRSTRKTFGAAIVAISFASVLLASSASAYIYTTCQNGCDRISRYSTAGVSLDQSFIHTSSADVPTGIAIDGRHIYWANYNATAGQGDLGRATLDDEGKVIAAETNQSIVSGLTRPLGVASYPKPDGTTFVYWVNAGTSTIGRVEFGPDGEIVGSPDPNFITGATDGFGMTFDDGVLYWGRWTDGDDDSVEPESFIGRAEIGEDGFLEEDPDIDVSNEYLADVESPNGLTATGPHLYWGNYGYAALGRVEFDPETGAADPETFDNHWADDGPMPYPDILPHPDNRMMFLPGGMANDGVHLYWTQRDLTLWDARADDIARREIADPYNSFTNSLFDPPGIAWGIAVQRDTATEIECPRNAGEVSCVLTVSQINNPEPQTPAGKARMAATGDEGTYPNGAECALVPTDEPGVASCTVVYDRDGTGGEGTSALYLGSADHAHSKGTGALLPVPVVIPPDPDPELPIPPGANPGGKGSGPGAGTAPGNSKSKSCKKKKKKKARKKCLKKLKKSGGR
jgi:hypothetical protein